MSTEKLKVLTVVDPDLQTIIQETFELGNIAQASDIFVARSASEAKQALEAKNFDLFILDHHFPTGPESNALPFLRYLRTIEPNTPVIVLTPDDSPETTQYLEEQKVTILQKPLLDIDGMISITQAIIEQGKNK